MIPSFGSCQSGPLEEMGFLTKSINKISLFAPLDERLFALSSLSHGHAHTRGQQFLSVFSLHISFCLFARNGNSLPTGRGRCPRDASRCASAEVAPLGPRLPRRSLLSSLSLRPDSLSSSSSALFTVPFQPVDFASLSLRFPSFSPLCSRCVTV
jgi:hypothetical protein